MTIPTLSPEANNLFLSEINEGKRYGRKCAAARLRRPDMRSNIFADCARAQAEEQRWAHRSVFTVRQILEAAIALEEYYAEHIREIDAA